jgi:hypothetical protein
LAALYWLSFTAGFYFLYGSFAHAFSLQLDFCSIFRFVACVTEFVTLSQRCPESRFAPVVRTGRSKLLQCSQMVHARNVPQYVVDVLLSTPQDYLGCWMPERHPLSGSPEP